MHTTAIHKKVSTDKESYVGKKNIIRNNDAVNNKGRIKTFLKYSSKGIFIIGQMSLLFHILSLQNLEIYQTS